jgi:hypothetical protein
MARSIYGISFPYGHNSCQKWQDTSAGITEDLPPQDENVPPPDENTPSAEKMKINEEFTN